MFPWLPFVKIPAGGIYLNSASPPGSPEVGQPGLGKGEGPASTPCTNQHAWLLKKAISGFFLCLHPPADFPPLRGHTAVTGKLIKPRNCEENAGISPHCQIKTIQSRERCSSCPNPSASSVISLKKKKVIIINTQNEAVTSLLELLIITN